MGYMRHHAIIVTGRSGDFIEQARQKACQLLGMVVSPVLDSVINSYQTILIAPDGSKEGWEESDAGDQRRDQFIAFLKSLRYSDGSSPLSWCEVQYGDDGDDDRLLESSRVPRGTEPSS